MEQTRQSLKGSRQLPLQQGLISELRMQGAGKKSTQARTEEERKQTVGTVKVWSVVE